MAGYAQEREELKRVAREAAHNAASDAATSARLQQKGLSEHQRTRYRVWLQSAEGHAYQVWKGRACSLIELIKARNDELAVAWRAEASEVVSHAERLAFTSGRFIAPSPRELRAGLAQRIAHVLLWVMLALSMGTFALNILLIIRTGGDVQVPLLVPLAAGALWLVVFVATLGMGDPAWAEENGAAQKAASVRRAEILGFDPLDHVDRLPEPWTGWEYNEHSEDVDLPEERLQAFMIDAFTALPSPRDLPGLTRPAVRDSSSEPSASVRALLVQFAADDARPAG